MEGGFFTDDGNKVDQDSIPLPSRCRSCQLHENEEIACSLTRLDQKEEIQNGEVFCCFGFKSIDPDVDEKTIFNEMNEYLRKKNISSKPDKVEPWHDTNPER